MIRTSAPGKMILLGEYAVLDGAPALVAAVDRLSQVTIAENTSGRYRISAPNLGLKHIEFTPERTRITLYDSGERTRDTLRYCLEVLHYFHQILAEKNRQFPPVDIIIDTSAFYDSTATKYGFGSSASLTVALLAGLLNYTEVAQISPSNIFSHALQVHSRAQGKRGSGIDVAASAFGGVLEYQMPDSIADFSPPISRSLPDNLYFQLIWTGNPASTTEILQKFYKKKNQDPRGHEEILSTLSVITRSGCEALKNHDTDSFLDNVSEFYHHMRMLGDFLEIPVVSEKHQRIHEIVTFNGGRYKPSGAGNGDIGIAFGDSPEVMSRIRKNLEKSTFQLLDAKITESGVVLNSAANEV